MVWVRISRALALAFLGVLSTGIAPGSSALSAPALVETGQSFSICSLLVDGKCRTFNLDDRAEVLRMAQYLQWKQESTGRPESLDSQGTEKRDERALQELLHLTELLLKCDDGRAAVLKRMLAETAAAARNAHRQPLPETVDFFQTPVFFLERLSRPIGEGQRPAVNLEPGNTTDSSRLDPQPSTFWRKPNSISKGDLYHGFGRATLLLESELVCDYAGPKESHGRNPGFDIECQGSKLKLKFAEVSSEPFAARIFDALGYHADPTDYAPRVRVRYSRKILQEFNSRKPLKTHFTFLGLLPLFTLDLQRHYDPFDYLNAAVLTNGVRWSGATLKRRLLRNPNLTNPELVASNYRPEVEAAIDYLETVPASVQKRIGKSIGPWDFGEMDHASRRELRGAGLLAAWLGWFDSRFDNTRLRIVHKNGKHELEHYFSDLGGVLGKTTGVLYARGELPNAFPWTFTRPPLWQGEHHLARPLRIKGYKPVARTPAFAAMTVDDARWMARLIGSLSQEQIAQALIASGFDSAQTKLYLAKLLSRRDQMLLDLGLASEFPLVQEEHGLRHFSYNPATEGALRIRLDQTVREAPVGADRIVNGKLVPSAGPSIESASRQRSRASIGFAF